MYLAFCVMEESLMKVGKRTSIGLMEPPSFQAAAIREIILTDRRVSMQGGWDFYTGAND